MIEYHPYLLPRPPQFRAFARVYDCEGKLVREEYGKPKRALTFDPPLVIPNGGKALVGHEPVDA
jgi:hypothetical protein